MQYRTLLTAFLMVAAASEVAAKGGNGFKNGGQGGQGGQQGQGGQGGQGGAAAQAQSASAAAAQATASSAAAAGGQGGGQGGGAQGDLTLDQAAVQTASAATGAGAEGSTAEQANSQTDNANFINICSGKTLTNGLQQVGGSCNGIPMGDIPAQNQMPSTIITNPGPMQDLPANQDITMVANIANIQTGTFTNPDVTYYSAPQALNGQGQIIGHTHFTVQDMGGNAAPQQALDPTKFAFFKGIDGPADAQGNVAATIEGGLPAGTYRVCTMSSSANHQPVLVAVAQRGAQDDCQKFTVGGAGGNAGGAAAGAAGAAAGAAGGAAAQQASAAGGQATASAAAGNNAQQQQGQNAGGAAAQQQQQGKGQQGGGKKGGKGGQRKRSSRFGRHARSIRQEA